MNTLPFTFELLVAFAGINLVTVSIDIQKVCETSQFNTTDEFN